MLNNYSNKKDQCNFNVQIINPRLANLIGLEESIVITQIDYWLKKCPKIKNNALWIYNSFESWHLQFQYWSISKLKRIFSTLEKQGLIISKKFNSNKYDQTKWYSLNYSELNKILGSMELDSPIKTNIAQIPNTTMNSSFDAKQSKRSDHSETIYNETENNTENRKNLSKILATKIKPKQEFDEQKREMLSIWNEIVEEGTKQIQLTDKRAKTLILRLMEHFDNDLKKWKDYCSKIASSKFLMGEVTPFKASIDWCLKEDSIIKILEGGYGVGDRITQSQTLTTSNLEQEIEMEADSSGIKQLKQGLLRDVGRSIYLSWFKKVRFKDDYGTLKIEAPTKFVREWVEQHYKHKIRQLYDSILGKEGRIEICCA